MSFGKFSNGNSTPPPDETLTLKGEAADAKAVGDALANQKRECHPRRGNVPDSDFNKATNEGTYLYVNDLTNAYRSSDAGTLEVFNNLIDGDGSSYGEWIYQIAHPVNGQTPWVRTRTDGGNWTRWENMASVVYFANNCIRYSNGLQICYGFATNITGPLTNGSNLVTFPLPFSYTPVFIIGQYGSAGGHLIVSGWETPTNASLGVADGSSLSGATAPWVAFGNWG